MIGVTGATGKLGSLAVEALMKRVSPEQIVMIVRNADKAKPFRERGVHVRTADYFDPATVASALKGIEKLLFISSNDRKDRVGQHKGIVDAAKRSGVKLIAFTSLLHTDRSQLRITNDFKETESYLRASGVPFVFLRNGWYTENNTAFLAPALKHGAIAGSAREGRFATASREDYAEAAAVVLTSPGHENALYELAGDESYTLAEFASKVSELGGKKVVYQDVGEAAFAKMLEGFGIPKQNAEELSESEAAAALGEHVEDSHDLSKLIGRPTTPWETTLSQALAKLQS